MFKVKAGSILDFEIDIDIYTGQRFSDTISIFSILVESDEFQWISQTKHFMIGWGKMVAINHHWSCPLFSTIHGN